MADFHQMVVHDVGEVISGQPIGFDQYGHVDLGPLNADLTAQQIIENAFTFPWHAQADYMSFAAPQARGNVRGGKAQAMSVIARLSLQP